MEHFCRDLFPSVHQVHIPWKSMEHFCCDLFHYISFSSGLNLTPSQGSSTINWIRQGRLSGCWRALGCCGPRRWPGCGAPRGPRDDLGGCGLGNLRSFPKLSRNHHHEAKLIQSHPNSIQTYPNSWSILFDYFWFGQFGTSF